MNITDIKIGERHRHDMGDLEQLADSIKKEGLLQPVGITKDNELVFGYRRLVACRDILGWYAIETRVVNVTSIVAGEYAENEIRKDFTMSERVAIMRTIETRGGGRPHKFLSDERNYKPTKEQIAAMVGFSNVGAWRAEKLVDNAPDLAEKVDKGELSVFTAFAAAEQEGRIERKKRQPSARTGSQQRGRQPIDRSAMFNNPRQLRVLPPEVSGRPVGAAALEQDPHSPPGVTRGMAHVEKYGRVQIVSPEEQQRRTLYLRFVELNAALKMLATGDWPTADDLARLDDRRRGDIVRQWRKWEPTLQIIFDMCRHSRENSSGGTQ